MVSASACEHEGRKRRLSFSVDPRTKFMIIIVMSIVLVASGHDVFGYVVKSIMAIVTLIFLVMAQKGRVALLFGTLFFSAVILEQVSASFLLNAISGVSIFGLFVRFLAFMMLFLAPATMFGYCMFTSTRVGEFVAAMDRMHLPQVIIIPFSVMFRFFPTIAEEYRCIQDAMRMRNTSWKRGPLVMIEYRAIPLIVSLVRISEDLSAASVARGLGGSVKRTHVCRIGFGVWDAVFLVVIMCSITACLLRWAMF